MITQETKPVKTWGGFNLAILKVNLNPLSWKNQSSYNWKNQSSYNKTYKPPRLTSYCYPPVKLTGTTTCKLWIHELLLSWILHQIQAHPLVFSLSFSGSNWNDHQGVEKSSPSLSACLGPCTLCWFWIPTGGWCLPTHLTCWGCCFLPDPPCWFLDPLK